MPDSPMSDSPMSDSSVGLQSKREAVQPSLWDRLVDDLPGLQSEIDMLGSELGKELGEERFARILAAGRRGIETEEGLDDSDRRNLSGLITMIERRDFLQERGIVVTADILREAVRRDIEALFNIERFEARPLLTEAERVRNPDTADLIADFPQVRRSVVNYGVPSFAGRSARAFDTDALARELKEIVAIYEPRLRHDTITVKVRTRDKQGMRIEIEGTLMLSPVPERLRLSTTIDLDNGRAATKVEDR